MPTSNSLRMRRIGAGRRNLIEEHGVNFCSCFYDSSHNIQLENYPLSTRQTINLEDKWLACGIKQSKKQTDRMRFSSYYIGQFTVLSFVARISCLLYIRIDLTTHIQRLREMLQAYDGQAFQYNQETMTSIK
jgi:hypothetical protein